MTHVPELEPVPRRLRGISLLPAAATLSNLLCGFFAIYCCLLSVRAEYGASFAVQPHVFPWLKHVFSTHIAAGAYLIVLAMFFDALDGRLARMTRRTSEFGAQLDSLSDIVSFGVAPAALLATLLLRPELNSGTEVQDATRLQFRIGLLCTLIYVSCAAIRLARFNAENVRGEAAHRAFSGLPTPGAAAALVALLAMHEDLRLNDVSLGGIGLANISRWVMSGVAVGLGILMVSRLDYVHVFNVYFRRKHPPTHLLGLLIIVGLAWLWFELLLVVVSLAYVLSGLLPAAWRGGGERHGDGDRIEEEAHAVR